MGARTREVEPYHFGHVVSPVALSGCGQAGAWTKLKRRIGRAVLLLRWPVRSYHWARAKRRAGQKVRSAGMGGHQLIDVNHEGDRAALSLLGL